MPLRFSGIRRCCRFRSLMSALIFSLQKDLVVIIMDTLATDLDGKPWFFCTKFYPLPHLNVVICGTGDAGMIGDWFLRINRSPFIDIIDLDQHSTEGLRDLGYDYGGHVTPTTTVY